MTHEAKNREGLTYAEWLAAATRGGTYTEDDRHRRSWREAEDPTEWRAWYEKQLNSPAPIGVMARSTKVTRTGVARVKQDWRCNFEDLVKVGDYCDEGIYQDFLGELPPVFNNQELLQLGEPSDHGPDGRPRYLTLQRAGLLWVFTGRRYLAEKVEIV